MTNISKIPLKQFSVCLKFHSPPDPSRHQPPSPPQGAPRRLTAAPRIAPARSAPLASTRPGPPSAGCFWTLPLQAHSPTTDSPKGIITPVSQQNFWSNPEALNWVTLQIPYRENGNQV